MQGLQGLKKCNTMMCRTQYSERSRRTARSSDFGEGGPEILAISATVLLTLNPKI